MDGKKWFTDAEIVKVIDAFCAAYPHLEMAKSDPRAFISQAATLPIPQGVSLEAVGKMFAFGRGQGLAR